MRELIAMALRYGSCLVFGFSLPGRIFDTINLILIACLVIHGFGCTMEEKLKRGK